MQWLNSTRSGLISLSPAFRQERAESRSAQENIEQVRQAMLDAMEGAGPPDQHVELRIKINYAGTIQTLWYARCEIMHALSAARGEAYAQRQLETLSAQFIGLLPEARHYRPGRRPR